MCMIFCNIYHLLCHIFINFRLSCSNFGGHFKGQNFKTHISGFVCKERRGLLKFSEIARHRENLIS